MERKPGKVERMTFLPEQKSIIPSCDFANLDKLRQVVARTKDVKGVSAYKIGFELVIPHGMRKIMEVMKEITDKPIIYDHQKGGTDIPDMGKKFMEACREVDAIIIFPQSGPETEKAWIKAAQDAGKTVIVGGEMTHPAYLQGDGGYVADDAPSKIYELAADLGVTDFVVPGNKPDKIKKYKQLLEKKGISPVFYSPGLIAQGGNITEGAKAAGKNWHAIVGRAIYNSENIKNTIQELVSQL